MFWALADSPDKFQTDSSEGNSTYCWFLSSLVLLRKTICHITFSVMLAKSVLLSKGTIWQSCSLFAHPELCCAAFIWEQQTQVLGNDRCCPKSKKADMETSSILIVLFPDLEPCAGSQGQGSREAQTVGKLTPQPPANGIFAFRLPGMRYPWWKYPRTTSVSESVKS